MELIQFILRPNKHVKAQSVIINKQTAVYFPNKPTSKQQPRYLFKFVLNQKLSGHLKRHSTSKLPQQTIRHR